MVKLKKNYILIILFAVLLSSGCKFTDSPAKAEIEKHLVDTKVTSVVNSETDKPKEEAAKNFPFHKKRDVNEQRILADGSQYLKMKDAHGNMVEYRYFDSDNSVKYISLQTLVNGESSMIIRTREGAIKRINSTQIDPWKSSLREISLLAGVPLEYSPQSE